KKMLHNARKYLWLQVCSEETHHARSHPKIHFFRFYFFRFDIVRFHFNRLLTNRSGPEDCRRATRGIERCRSCRRFHRRVCSKDATEYRCRVELNQAGQTALFEIREVDWPAGKDQLSAIRTAVFIREQHVPPALEWDELDVEAIHLLALDWSGNAIGCARILGNGNIGRMAVLPAWLGKGVGTA